MKDRNAYMASYMRKRRAGEQSKPQRLTKALNDIIEALGDNAKPLAEKVRKIAKDALA